MTGAGRGLWVHRPEPRSSQGEENGGMTGNRLVDALATDQTGAHQVRCVTSVEGGAWIATQLAV